MRNSSYSTVDPENGNITYSGPLEVMKGDHSHMPARTEAYLPGDERGHINASSLGGVNDESNVAPQHRDLNHGAYYSMERGERTALQNGAAIDSTKIAVVNGHPGDRPEAFMVTDMITYADDHVETIHHSFTNVSNAEQEAWNDASAALPDIFDAPNPGDALRSSMSSEEYASLMESTDAQLPGIADDYAPAQSSQATTAGNAVSTSSAGASASASSSGD